MFSTDPVIRGPGIANYDFSLFKRTSITERFNLEFRTDYLIDDPRIARKQQLSARRFEHTVKVQTESDINPQLLQWLKDAYELGK